MRILTAIFLILIFWLLLLTMVGCQNEPPFIMLENPRPDYIWNMSPNFHAFVVCILLIIVAWLILKVYDFFKGKK